jgi:hypothetical protein
VAIPGSIHQTRLAIVIRSLDPRTVPLDELSHGRRVALQGSAHQTRLAIVIRSLDPRTSPHKPCDGLGIAIPGGLEQILVQTRQFRTHFGSHETSAIDTKVPPILRPYNVFALISIFYTSSSLLGNQNNGENVVPLRRLRKTSEFPFELSLSQARVPLPSASVLPILLDNDPI